MTTDHNTETCELTPDQLEEVSGGMFWIGFAFGFACTQIALGQDHTVDNLMNFFANVSK